MNPKLAPLKAGDTFSYAGTCKLPAGLWTATCEVRTWDGASTLIGTVAVTLGTEVSGETPIALYAAASATATWPVATHEVDIRYADAGGVVVHSSTMLLPVVQSITGA